MQKRKEKFLMRLHPLLFFILLLPTISPNVQLLVQPPNHLVTYPHEPPLIFSSNLARGQSLQSSYPMGIADYGMSPSGPFVRETTQWLGIVYVESLLAISNTNNSYFNHTISFQLNTVLNYEYNGKNYALWLQDIAFYNTLTHGLCFLDNVWNFTALNANITGVSGNGEAGSSFYAYVDKESYINITPPFAFDLLVNVTTNSQGQPVIYFWYNDGNGWVNFDTVTVNVTNASNVYFLVDGYNHTPNGLYYDAALVMGGPYGGSTAQIINGTVFFQLLYWNDHNFQEVRNALNVGYDTGETVKNANVQYYIDPSNGALYAEITAGQENPGIFLWDEDNTTQLTVYAQMNNGYIYVYNGSLPYSDEKALKVPFVGGEATLTLYPMDYAILVYQNDKLVGEANIYAGAGQSVSTNTTQFSVSLNKTQITLHSHQSYTLNVTINAYGNVTVNVISPHGVKTSLTQEVLYVQGQKTIDLTVCPTQNGAFDVIINASLFPVFYEIQLITLYVNVDEKLFVTFEYNVIGQPLPQEPEITLTYPNGTTVTLQLYNFEVICVPPGSTYFIQQIISEGDVRWATPALVTGVINENFTINVTYYEQYLVNFEYGVINGQWNLTPPNVTYQCFSQLETVTVPTKIWVNYNSSYCYSPSVVVGDERIVSSDYKGVVTSHGTVYVYYTLQYYITIISPIPVYAIIDGKNVSLSTGWYNVDEVIQIENLTYSSSSVKYIITLILPSETFVVTSPMTIKINTMEQFYVTVSSPIPVYALINGKNETLESGCYNANTTIQVENITYYQSNDVRYVIIGIYPSRNITIDSPLTIQIRTVEQYYVTVNSNIPLKVYMSIPINSHLPLLISTYLNSSWVDQGAVIYVLNRSYYYDYYISNDVRYILTGIHVSPFINPGITCEVVIITNNSVKYINPDLIIFVVDSPVTVNVSVIEQFYVNVSSSIPIYALINGTNQTLTSNWFNANTTIYIENITYYLSQDIRYIILGIQPSQKIVVTSPATIVIHTVKQFLITVKVNGTSTYLWVNQGTVLRLINYTFYITSNERYLIVNSSPQYLIVDSPMIVNATAIKQFLVTINNVSTWYNQGARITLTANVPIYDIAEFVGTYNVSPNAVLTVSSPITEKLVIYPNYEFYSAVIGIAVIIVAVVILLLRKRRS